MYSIYFDNKIITFTLTCDSQCDFEVARNERIDTTKVLQKVENSKAVTIKAERPKEVFDDFCSFFKLVEAAGGLVCSACGDVLMIYRNDHWDLPKGHREVGETLEQCAVREVEEECGVSGVVCGEQIAVTMHCYNTYGPWELKQTYWYSMSCPSNQPLWPQTSEGISKVEWVTREQVDERLVRSYMTIRDVFNKAK